MPNKETDESTGVRRGDQDQEVEGRAELTPGGEYGDAGKEEVGAESRRWAGKGPEAAGNSQPHPRRSICGVTQGHL